MATKTIVCPECQAPATPGRYACAECGALLASVGLTPRAFDRGELAAGAAIVPSAGSTDDHGDEPDGAPTVATLVDDRPAIVVAPVWTQSLAAEPVESEPSEDERWDDELPDGPAVPSAHDGAMDGSALEAPSPPTEPAPIAASAALAKLVPEMAPPVVAPTAALAAELPEPPAVVTAPAAEPAAADPKRRAVPRPRRQPDPSAIDRIAPLAAAAAPVAAPEWPVVQPEPDAEAAFAARLALAARAGLATAPIAPAEPVESLEPVESGEIDDEVAASVGVRAVPGWPPPGDLTMTPEPTPRVPAGSYLPPSAVLPPGDALPPVVAANVRGHELSASTDASRASSARAAAAARLADLGLPADSPRRVVAIGAAVAALGFFLPWTATPGGDLIGDYWARWGLAGPGHWIVAGLLVALAVLCLSSGRLATVAVGLPAVAVAALLLGLSWPYLFGFFGRAVGLWVVVAGLLLLVAGGLLELRSGRHDDEVPAV